MLTGVPLGLNGQLLGAQQPNSPSALNPAGLAANHQLAFLQGRGGQMGGQAALANFPLDPTGAAGLQPGAYYSNQYYQ